jgi:hypothetical protein
VQDVRKTGCIFLPDLHLGGGGPLLYRYTGLPCVREKEKVEPMVTKNPAPGLSNQNVMNITNIMYCTDS